MRIAIFTDTFLPSYNGIVTSVVNSAKELAKKGHEILILTPGKKKRLSLGKNIRIVYLPGLSLIDYPGLKIGIPSSLSIRSLLKFNPGIIHCHMPSLICWEGLLFAKAKKIPVIGTYNTALTGFLYYVKMPVFPRDTIANSSLAKSMTWEYSRQFYNRCTAVIAPTPAIKSELKEHGIRRPIHTISNGVNIGLFYPRKVRKTRAILHVGRVSYEKRIDVLLKALKIIQKEMPHAKLIIAGDGPDLRKLRTLSQKLKVNVEFLGKQSQNTLPALYSKCCVFATASPIETEGLVILEAMACGLPVVGVDALAIPSIVTHGKDGYIAKTGDHKAIAAFLGKLLRNKKMRTRMGSFALQRARQSSVALTVPSLEELYHSLQ